jgi:DNA topoisomerase-1
MRVGNDEYARENGSFGLTTLRDTHVRVQAGTLRFQFRGKGGKAHRLEVHDPRLARVVRRCRDLPGYELFQYPDDGGRLRDVGSGDVNAYLEEIAGEDFTAKDFRTWAGTVLAAVALQEFAAVDSKTQARRNVVRAIERVATQLGNTPAICRKSYVHPAVIDAYLEGHVLEALRRRARERLAAGVEGLSPVLGLLQQRLEREAERDACRAA